MDKTKYIEKAMVWAKKNGFSDLKADIDGQESPFAYERSADKEKFIPNLTGKLMNRKSYFEVVMKSDDESLTLSRISLFYELARMKGSKLYLMAPSGHLKYTRELAQNARLIDVEVVGI